MTWLVRPSWSSPARPRGGAGVAAAERVAGAREERRRIDEGIAAASARRGDWEVRSAGIVERKRVLAERLAEVERRLTGHAEERREAAARRERLEAHANTVGRLLAVVASAQDVLEVALGELRARHRPQREAVRAGGVKLEELRRQRTSTEQELAATRTRRQENEVALVESEIRRESLVETLRRELAATPEEALAAGRPDLPEGVEMAVRAEQLEAEIAAIGPVNPLALDELTELGERHRFLEEQVDDVRKARRELHQVIRTLDDEIMQVFAGAFADVNEHFSNLVTSLFPGGTGRLSLTDPENLLDTGVEVEVRPAGRNVRRLSLLSGGERSLVAMAYLFAVFRSRPSPFYLMDEVEAALDDVNLMRFLALVHEFREEAQLIIVSHQKRTMEAADALYGVTMAPGGSSKVLSQKIPRQRDETEADPSSRAEEFADTAGVATGPGRGAPGAVGEGMCCTIRSATGWPEPSESAIPSRDRHRVLGRVGSRARRRGRDSGARRGCRGHRGLPRAPAPHRRPRPGSPHGHRDGARRWPSRSPPVARQGGRCRAEAVAPPEPVTYRSRLGKARGLLSGYLGSIRSEVPGRLGDVGRPRRGAHPGRRRSEGHRRRSSRTCGGGWRKGRSPAPTRWSKHSSPISSGCWRTTDTSRRLRVRVPRRGSGDRVDVWLFVGVNGVGKTTTVGKVARRLATDGAKVLLAAADTFRAAAGEQLSTWATRTGADIVHGSEGGDPGSVVFDAVQRAASRGHAVVLADTAGRLHNKVNLIEELKKVRRVADRPPGTSRRCCSSSTPRPARTASPRPRSSSRRSRSPASC